MPYADHERQKQAKRESDARHADQIAARKKRRYWEHVDVTRANENERNWRMSCHMRMSPEARELVLRLGCSYATKLSLASPVFIVEHNGVRRREILTDTLPTWEQNG